jgi:hypothetical protein
MALILNNSLYIHIPKTGGTWVCEAIKNAGLVRMKSKRKHPSLAEFRTGNEKHPKLKDLRVFTFIRNPVTWWQSRWSDPFMRDHYLKGLKPEIQPWLGSIRWLNHETMISSKDQFDDFNTYIKAILSRRSGFAWEYFRYMTNVKGIELGKYERIEKDLVDLLFMVGEDFDISTVLNTPKANESDPKLKQKRLYTEENLRRIIDSEKRLMDLHGYSTKPEDYVNLVR